MLYQTRQDLYGVGVEVELLGPCSTGALSFLSFLYFLVLPALLLWKFFSFLRDIFSLLSDWYFPIWLRTFHRSSSFSTSVNFSINCAFYFPFLSAAVMGGLFSILRREHCVYTSKATLQRDKVSASF